MASSQASTSVFLNITIRSSYWYETFEGGWREAMYGFRRFLDERGCRFPASYDPPVHWGQLYDMEGV